MTIAQLTKWGERYGLALHNVQDLQALIRLHKIQQEHACNGDPHRSVADKSDKSANAAAWERDSDATDRLLDALALSLGFDHVDYGVGLYPALIKGNEDCIMVP